MAEQHAVDPNVCYRHPSRQSYILCQRCGRTVCAECQTQAAVGVHCPECVKEARHNAPKRKPSIVTAFRPTSGKPVVTYSIIAITVLVYALQWMTGGLVTGLFAYAPVATEAQPWRMLTVALVHSQSSIFHIIFNMYSLFLFGPVLEHLVGRTRFLALYVISALGGSVAVLLLSPGAIVVGASGAIFGLLGAFFVIQRKLGNNSVQLFILLALNLAIGFFIPNISWQGHVGGLVAGAIVAVIYLQTRRPNQRSWQIGLLIALTGALIATTIVGYTAIFR